MSDIQPLAIAKAVALAFIAAVVLAAIAGIGLGLFGGFFVDENGDSLFLEIAIFSIGAAPAAMCGYFAAHFAHHRPLTHSAVSGVTYLALLFLLSIWLNEHPISWTDGIHFLITVPLALLGGWIYVSQSDS